jgi:hypothetical protein
MKVENGWMNEEPIAFALRAVILRLRASNLCELQLPKEQHHAPNASVIFKSSTKGIACSHKVTLFSLFNGH